MSDGSKNKHVLSGRLYGALLAAYPSEFRREFGREMTLVFRERCREEESRGIRGHARVWSDALLDICKSVPKEHAEKISGGVLMRVLRTVLIAILVYAFTLLVLAPLYVRNREMMPGFVNSLIDAMISTGIIFNVIFLVLALTRIREGVRAVRAAALATGIIIAGLIALMALSGGPEARPNAFVYIAQVVSLFIWFSLHLWWVLRKRPATRPPATA
jgi:hypothetical protein